jgi:site-specific DNA recombinase
VPALVSEELFAAVQVQLQENRQRARQGQRGARYLLQGLLVCAQCGYAFYGKPVSTKVAKGEKRNYAYYRCIGSDAFRFGGERICDNHQVRTDLLDQIVWQEVCGLLQDQERLLAEYDRRLNSPARESKNLSTLQAQQGKIQQGITRLIDSYAEGFVQKVEFEPRITHLRQRLLELEQQELKIQDQANLQAELQVAISRLEEFGEKVKTNLAEADWHMRRELIRMLVKRVEIGNEEIKVVFRIPLDQGASEPEGNSLQHCWQRHDPTLRRPSFRVQHLPICVQHSCIQPLLNQPQKCLVVNPLCQHI